MKGSASQLAVVLGISLAAAGATWFLEGSPQKAAPKDILCNPEAIRKDEICLSDVGKDVLWVDARSRSEWERNGLDGSLLWNLDPQNDAQAMEADAAMAIVSTKPAMVVVYCGSEACGTSRQIADRIRALDLGPPIKALHGGWDALRSR